MHTHTTTLGLILVSMTIACGSDKNDSDRLMNSESDTGVAANVDTEDDSADEEAADGTATEDSGNADTEPPDNASDTESETDSGDADTIGSDTGDAGSIDAPLIELGTRFSGYIFADGSFGEITWEKATPDGSQCQIQGLMSEIVLLEEACDTCDWGATFTITGMAITLDEGACDRTVFELDGMAMTFGHGHIPLSPDGDSDHYQLFQMDEGVWTLRENGFSESKIDEESGSEIWAFGEELTDEPSTDGEGTDEAVGMPAYEWQATLNTTDLMGSFTYEQHLWGESCTVSGDIIDVLMSDGCVDCEFSASFTLFGLSVSPSGSSCSDFATSMEGTTESAGHGLDRLHPGIPTDDRYILWDHAMDGWYVKSSGWSRFDASTSEWVFGERILEE